MKVAQKKRHDDDHQETTEEADEAGERVVTYYPMLSVFDISQTDLIDPDGDPAALAQQLEGEDPEGIADAVTDYLTGQAGPSNTRSSGQRQRVHRPQGPPGRDRLQPFAGRDRVTLLHEAAHVILHAEDTAAEYHHHRGIKETEAESVAYVVAGLLGLDTTPSCIRYVAGWTDGDTDTIKNTAARVLGAVRTLADALISEDGRTRRCLITLVGPGDRTPAAQPTSCWSRRRNPTMGRTRTKVRIGASARSLGFKGRGLQLLQARHRREAWRGTKASASHQAAPAWSSTPFGRRGNEAK